MNDLDKILHKLRLCASRHAPQLASRFFRLLLLDKYAVSIAQVSHPVWENIAEFVKAILHTDIAGEQRIYLQKLYEISSTKNLQEDKIGHIVTAHNLRRATLFSNYNAFRYAVLIKKLLSHSSGSEGAVSTAEFFKSRLDKSTEDKNMLFSAVRFLHRQREQQFFETGKTAYLKTMEFYETLFASMIHNLKQVHQREIFYGFQTCDLCWRLVPPQNSTICRCELHTPQNPGVEYTRALRIGKFWGKNVRPKP